MTQSLKKNWFVVLNMTSQNSKVWKFHFDGLFLSKVYKVWTKKYRGIIFHDAEQWCKIWIIPESVVSKMAWGIGWTFIGALKSLKNCTLMGLFGPKFKGKLVAWKMTSGIWLIFMWAIVSLKICLSMGSFCKKHIKI